MGIMTKEAVLDLIDRMRTSDPKANGFYEGTAQWAAWQEARNLTDMSLLQVLEDIICEQRRQLQQSLPDPRSHLRMQSLSADESSRS